MQYLTLEREIGCRSWYILHNDDENEYYVETKIKRSYGYDSTLKKISKEDYKTSMEIASSIQIKRNKV